MGGILIVILFVVMVFFEINPLVASKKLDFGFIILPIFIFFSVKEFRDFKNEGKLRFWQAIALGMLTLFILSALSAIIVWSFLSLFSDDFLKQYIIDRTYLLEEYKPLILESTSEEVYERTFQDLQNVTPAILAFDDFLKKIFTGIFITLIISVILRR
ncbi:MAG: DUF4199 domain-containing protein [Bacteroidota bacterium]|nr:DUF4199 domain-containing protein [Bacteroidota bacterium]